MVSSSFGKENRRRGRLSIYTLTGKWALPRALAASIIVSEYWLVTCFAHVTARAIPLHQSRRLHHFSEVSFRRKQVDDATDQNGIEFTSITDCILCPRIIKYFISIEHSQSSKMTGPHDCANRHVFRSL